MHCMHAESRMPASTARPQTRVRCSSRPQCDQPPPPAQHRPARSCVGAAGASHGRDIPAVATGWSSDNGAEATGAAERPSACYAASAASWCTARTTTAPSPAAAPSPAVGVCGRRPVGATRTLMALTPAGHTCRSCAARSPAAPAPARTGFGASCRPSWRQWRRSRPRTTCGRHLRACTRKQAVSAR